MNLSNLKPAEGSTKNRKRIGRGTGSGRGGTSTRGHKGAGSRSGTSTKIGFEGGQMPLQRRLPKRGFTSLTHEFVGEVRLSDLEKLPVDEVDLLALKQAGLLGVLITSAKIIKTGELTRKITVKGLNATKGARAAIEAAGGSFAE